MIKEFINKYMLYISGAAVAVVIGAFGWLWVDNALTKAALENAQTKLKTAEQVIAAQQRATEAMDRVDALEQRLNRTLREYSTRIMDAEGANNEIPTDVAALWAASDDSLRAQADGSDTGSAEGMHSPR
mgnify:CR=1 FL=1